MSSKNKIILGIAVVLVTALLVSIFMPGPEPPNPAPSETATATEPAKGDDVKDIEVSLPTPSIAPSPGNNPRGDIHVGVDEAPAIGGKAGPDSITLNKTELTLTKGNTYILRVDFEPETAKRDVTWSSDNEKAVGITEKGKITGLGEGKAVITAKTPNGKTASCTVTVKRPAG